MKAKFDERLSLLSLLMDAASNDFKDISVTEGMMTVLESDLRTMKAKLIRSTAEGAAELLTERGAQLEKKIQAGRKSNSMYEEIAHANRHAVDALLKMSASVLTEDVADGMRAFCVVKRIFGSENAKLKTGVAGLRDRLGNMFAFCERAFPDGQELLILVTELTRLLPSLASSAATAMTPTSAITRSCCSFG